MKQNLYIALYCQAGKADSLCYNTAWKRLGIRKSFNSYIMDKRSFIHRISVLQYTLNTQYSIRFVCNHIKSCAQ